MQRYNIVNYYDFPIDVVVELLMEKAIYNLNDLPNVSTNELIEERDTGDKKFIKVKWCVHGQIPKAAQMIIRPETLTFLEDSVWDRKTRVYSTKIIPHFFKNQVDARHKVEFHDNKDGRTKRVLSGTFEFKIPIVGAIFEPVVLHYLKQNAEEDFKIGNNALGKWIKENGMPDLKK